MKARVILAACAAFAALAACSERELSPVRPENPAPQKNLYSTDNIVYAATLSGDIRTGLPGGGTVTAGFSGATRSHLEMNDAGTYAGVVWDSGDSFMMLAYDSGMYGATYKTTAGGLDATFSTGSGLPAVDKYYCLSCNTGGYADLSDYGYGMTFLVAFPTEQTATRGNVSAGCDLSGICTSSRTEHLSFKNFGSLLKFRLDGAAVSGVRSVTIKGSSMLAGEGALYFEDDGSPALFPYAVFQDQETSNKITLSGTFEAGCDYYVALMPGTQGTLTLTFSDGADGVIVKTVSQPVTFDPGRIKDFGTLRLGDSFGEYEAPDVAELYIEAASGLKPVSIAVVPDGFTESELGEYQLLARSAVNAMFSTEPFKSYRQYFNVWILSVASAESGANITDGNGNITTARNCYFGSRWGEDSYGDMSLDETTLYSFVKEYCPDLADKSHTEAEVAVLVIINDDRYGGICHSYSNGKAYCQAPVSYGGGQMGWSYPEITAVSDSDPSRGTRSVTDAEYAALGINYGDWRNTVVHEFVGHAFSRLNDEYWYEDVSKAVSSLQEHSWPVPFGLNISATYNNPPWRADLLARKTSLVASDPLYDRLGVYQGGDVSPLNRWRCEKISCMIDNRFYFSLWQRELIVKRIMTLAGGTFNLESFLSLDSPVDPVRDVTSSGVLNPSGQKKGVAPVMPPLPPPVLKNL